MKVINTSNAPAAIGPYSQAVAAGDFLYTSGQIALSPQGLEIAKEDIYGQTRMALDNLTAVIAAAGADLSKVVKTTCFLADMADFEAFNSVYAEYFTQNKPARSCVAAKALPRAVLCEIEAVVYLK